MTKHENRNTSRYLFEKLNQGKNFELLTREF